MKCIVDLMVIVSSTSGSCRNVNSACATNEVFVRSTLDNDANHLGSCKSSTICSLYDYSSNRGFADVASGENKCKKCIIESQVILSSTNG